MRARIAAEASVKVAAGHHVGHGAGGADGGGAVQDGQRQQRAIRESAPHPRASESAQTPRHENGSCEGSEEVGSHPRNSQRRLSKGWPASAKHEEHCAVADHGILLAMQEEAMVEQGDDTWLPPSCVVNSCTLLVMASTAAAACTRKFAVTAACCLRWCCLQPQRLRHKRGPCSQAVVVVMAVGEAYIVLKWHTWYQFRPTHLQRKNHSAAADQLRLCTSPPITPSAV